MTYAEALNYIHGVSNFFCKPGLVRIKELCHGLGNPQNELKFIHVTGTNGKTSITYMIKSVLEEMGKKVGIITDDAITGATITSRAVCDGVNAALDCVAGMG